MEASILNHALLNWMASRLVAIQPLILRFSTPWAIEFSAPMTNGYRSIEFRAKFKQGGTRHKLAMTNAPNSVASPNETEVWMPQVWMDELAEMTDG